MQQVSTIVHGCTEAALLRVSSASVLNMAAFPASSARHEGHPFTQEVYSVERPGVRQIELEN